MLGNSKMLKKGLLSTAAVALVGAGLATAPKDAEAVAFAYSALEVSAMNLTVFNADNTVAGGIKNLGPNNGADGDASDGGFTSFQFQLNSLFVQLGGTPAFQIGQTSNASGASLDVNQLCLTSCAGFSENNWTTNPGDNSANPVVPGGATSFAVADSHMLNTVLNGGATFGVQAGARSEGGGTFASGSQTADNFMNWNFSTDADDGGKRISLDWIEDRLLEVSTTADGESAQAGITFTIELEKVGGGTQVLFDLSPTGVATAANDPAETQTGLSDSGILITSDAGTGVLDANSSYNLVFRFASSASATSPLPEPGALGFLGLSLLGLGALRYRRRKQQAA